MASGFKKIKLFTTVVTVLAAVSFFHPAILDAAAPLGIKWTRQLKAGNRAGIKRNLNFATPQVAGDRLFVGNSGGNFYSIDIKRGKVLWRIKLDGPVISKPLFEDGVLYLGDGKGVVYSINASNGEKNWHSYVGEEVMTTPVADKGSIYVATENNSLFALDKSAGAIKWMKSRPMPFSAMSIRGFSSPILIDGNIYVGNTDGVLVVYEASNGNKLFTLPVAAQRAVFTDIDTTPLKHEGRIIFSSMEGGLYSVDHKTGKEHWTQLIGTPNNIAYSEGLLYVTASGKAYCIKIETGEKVWENDLDVPELSEAALTEKYIATVSTNDRLFLLDKATGDIVYHRSLGGGSFGSPVVADGKILLLTNSGQVYAFKIR